ncbi:MAG: ABC transporter ATP-binding protein [candidate division KSB1 bacterium]|nr:ABC transporter ATP-binding protein [candidate division KSB1 bacterium]MDZ7367804.1 ABC transporter ATP-binding protein [candidate division KSB1 bacterium]MDZ7404868.1 ABC transporter ATP-binding protein [candidate division KSB1 bacterium]
MARVRFESIKKSFGNTPAVRDLSLEIREGEFFSILGPSGCGKTTTLRIVAGFEPPDSGRIFFDNDDVTALPPERRNTGMVFQNYALFPHLSVFENVAFGLRARKRPQQEIEERVAAALDLVEMRELQNRLVPQLSGGQQQRVALARAIAVQPKILLLDEPLSNLDAQLRRSTRSELKNLQRRLGITTIYVTHDQEEALALSDRILVMHRGEAQQIGAPEEIYHQPANLFVMSFIGASNTLTGKVVQVTNHQITIAGESWQLALPMQSSYAIGTTLHLAFRPEHAQLQLNQAPERGDLGTLAGEMKSIEFGGSHWLVQCAIGQQRCFVRVPAEELKNAAIQNLMTSRKIRLSILPQHLRLFAAN